MHSRSIKSLFAIIEIDYSSIVRREPILLLMIYLMSRARICTCRACHGECEKRHFLHINDIVRYVIAKLKENT